VTVRQAVLAVLAAVAVCCAAAPAPAGAQAAGPCQLVVAPGGDDAAAGTPDAPLATPGRLAERLRAGQVGCVRGRVRGDLWITASGATVMSEPGQRGAVLGQLVVDAAAANVTVRDLDLDATGKGQPGPVLLGDDTLLAGNDVTNDTICILVGAAGHHSGARAERVRIVGNRVHDCGVSDNHVHGIYLENAADAQIVGNDIFDNADRGIQLYPDAQRTLIAGNVLDGNGEGVMMSGVGGLATSGTVVRNNVLTHARLRSLVESYWDGVAPGAANVVEDNCIFGERLIDDSQGGFTARNNLVADPLYVDRGAHDYRLQAGSPCAALLAGGRAGVHIPAVPPGAGAAAPAPAPVALSPAAARRRAARAPASQLRLSIKRRGGVVRIGVRLRRTPTARTSARVAVRTSRGRWRVLGVRQVTARRAVTFTGPATGLPRRLRVRTTLLRAGRRAVVTFSGARGG
jgi:parallel beta-helix repeat protein